MDIETKLDLITSAPIEEVITRDELKHILETNNSPRAYDGFEPSGILHIGSGLMRAIKIKELQEAGIHFTLWLADWHAWLNNKLGGDLESMRKVGEYFIEGWKAFGLDTSKLEIQWVSDAVEDPGYWKLVMQVAKATTLNRAKRCLSIMGRKEAELKQTAQLFYPCMQVADIFYLDIDICQLGMDQRRANMLARELAPKLGLKKPVAVHHHMLAGLQSPSAMGSEFDDDSKVSSEISNKMSKSKPDSSIYIHDSPQEIERKIKKAFCEPKNTKFNPMLEYAKYIIFKSQKDFTIERPKKFGGPVAYSQFKDLEQDFAAGKLHPQDLKAGIARDVTKLLEPARKHFASGEPKRLYDFVKGLQVTR